MNEKEFIDLIDQHQGIIHKICRIYTDIQEDYDDLFQEIMVQLWQAMPRYKGKSKITTYMYKVALFTALNKMKQSNKMLYTTDELPDRTEDAPQKSAEAILKQVLTKLNMAEKALISLYLDERDYKEIAEILGITESNVGVRLNRLKKKMKAIIKVQEYGI